MTDQEDQTTHRAGNLHKSNEAETPLRKVKGRMPSIVKDTANVSTRAFGMATATFRPDPDFLIIGTKRGGTTSLWKAMVEHPDVLPMFPAIRESKSAHYFDLNYSRGSRWYHSHFATRQQRERHFRHTGVRPITGEASPYYMFHPLAAGRIHADLPSVRLIVSLRDPVDRIWSHYRERVGGGTETLTFREALEAEAGRLAGEENRIRGEAPDYNSFHHDFSSYLARGRYEEHLRPYVELFGDRLLVLRAEDYYSDENAELTKMSQFLGIPPYPDRPVTRFNEMPRSDMLEEDREWLVEYYRPHVTRLESLLGRPMNWSHFR